MCVSAMAFSGWNRRSQPANPIPWALESVLCLVHHTGESLAWMFWDQHWSWLLLWASMQTKTNDMLSAVHRHWLYTSHLSHMISACMVVFSIDLTCAVLCGVADTLLYRCNLNVICFIVCWLSGYEMYASENVWCQPSWAFGDLQFARQ